MPASKRAQEPQEATPSISAAGIRALLNAAQRMGLDLERIRRAAELESVDLDDCELRLSCQYAAKIYRAAKDAWPGEDFGLQHGRVYQPFMLGIVGQLLICAPTLLEGLQSYQRYQRSFGDGVRLELAEQGELLELSLWLHPSLRAALEHDLADSVLLAALQCVRSLAGPGLGAHSVSLRRPAPDSAASYAAAFDCPVRFAQDRDVLSLPKAECRRPLLQANGELFVRMEGEAQALLQRLAATGALTRQVRAAVLKSFDGNKPDIAGIARALGMSPRTLQRKLGEEGRQFGEVLDEVRCEFAAHHLRGRRASIEELAYVLGYSEDRAFRRAFKRWTGLAPSEFRRRDESAGA